MKSETTDHLKSLLELVRRTARGGSIVSTAALHPAQIAVARAENRMWVAEDGLGFVYVPGEKAEGA